MLNSLLAEVYEVHLDLMSAERYGQSLKEDRFLSAIRQRFNLPGGSCCFDLPALHYRLHLPLYRKMRDAQQWMQTVTPLSNALKLWLKLTRETGHYRSRMASNGFYQSDAEDANILRLAIPLEYGMYPMISGHKTVLLSSLSKFTAGKPALKISPLIWRCAAKTRDLFSIRLFSKQCCEPK